MPYLTKSEVLSLASFRYTDKTFSFHIQNRNVSHYKSLVDKKLVEILPDAKYPGISLAKLTEYGIEVLRTLP
jgi:hypothetical protein